VEITITGANGDAIRTLTETSHPRLNRVWWDLRYESGSRIVMQVPPLNEPWAPAQRNYAAYGTRIPPAGPIVPPGTYRVQVKAGTQQKTVSLTVLPDPHSPGTTQTITAQVNFVRQVLSEIDQVAQMGNHLETLRKMGQDASATAAKDPSKSAVVQEAKAFDDKLSAVEAKMIDLRNTGRSEDAFRQPVQLYERISWMIGQMIGGNGSGGGDLGPTAQQVAVNEGFKQELAAIKALYDALIKTDVPAFEAMLRRNGINPVVP
jgi:hypothetical protein